MNTKFANATTSTAFTLNLSRWQVAGLWCIHDGCPLSDVDTRTLNSLMGKGLVEVVKVPKPVGKYNFTYQRFKLTDTGMLVFELCKHAGLIDKKIAQPERMI